MKIIVTFLYLSTLLLTPLLVSCVHLSDNSTTLPTLDPMLTQKANIQIDLQGTAPIDLTHWWRSFNDPGLNSLIEITMNKNFDIAIAYWQWRQSLAQSNNVNASQLPEVSANLQGNQQRSLSSNADNDTASTRRRWSANLQTRWEIDLWDKLRHSADAARAQMRASEAIYQGVWLSVLCEVADLYFQWQQLAQQQQLIKQSTELLLIVEKNIQQRVKFGASNHLQWIQAQAERQQQQIALQQMHTRQYAIQQQLNLLTGNLTLSSQVLQSIQSTENFNMDAVNSNPDLVIPAKLQINLLERRPDIRQAYEQLQQAWSSKQAAKVAHLPSLELLGNIGSATRSIGNLFGQSSTTYQLNGSLAGIIWQGARFKSAIDAADAHTQQQFIAYQRAVLNAIFEVDVHIIQYQQHQKNIEHWRKLQTLQQTALTIAKQRYHHGEEDVLYLLNAQRAFVATQQALIGAKRDQQRHLVRLYQSLGGGWPDDREKQM